MGKVQASFGGSFREPSPHRQYAVKVKWIIGIMFGLIVLLISGVAFLIRDLQDAQLAQATVPPPAPPLPVTPDIPSIRVLVPINTIDERAKLSQDTFTVTILATEKDAKVIQLAASMGQITLSLVGDNESAKPTAEQERTTDIVSLTDVLKKERVAQRPKVTSTDPVTGKPQNYLFRDGDWILAEDADKVKD